MDQYKLLSYVKKMMNIVLCILLIQKFTNMQTIKLSFYICKFNVIYLRVSHNFFELYKYKKFLKEIISKII